MLRASIMLGFYILMAPLCALVMVPHLWITGDILPFYRVGTWIAITGVRLAGVRIRLLGMEQIDPGTTYIFMSNHVSNLDPPIIIPSIQRHMSVLVKASLFRFPIFGYAMKKARMVPVRREDRESAIESIHAAAQVLREGISIMIFPEGTRSRTGELLPFKKGPFYMAEEAAVPILPITIRNTAELMPKGKFEVRKGEVTVIFHPPLNPKDYEDREQLMEAVRTAIRGSLPARNR